MPRYLVVFTAFTLATSVAGAQEAMAPAHPQATVSPVSAIRYEAKTPVSPVFGDNTPISFSSSRRLVGDLRESTELSKIVEEETNLALACSGTIAKEDVAVTLLEVTPCLGGSPRFGHLHGNDPRYASGVARVVWAAALFRALQERAIDVNPRLEADIIKMLHDGDTKASGRIIDFVTGTRSGASLGYSCQFAKFATKRDFANYVLSNLGFVRFNVNQKLSTSIPSGRDAQLLGRKLPLNYENSNRLTSNQAAALMYLVDQEVLVSRCASRAIKAYLFAPLEQRKVDVLAGSSAGVPVGSQVVTVNGYTSRNNHDVSKIVLPNGKQYVLAVFTKYRSNPTTFATLLSRQISNRFLTATGDDDINDYLNIPALAGQ